MRGADVLATAIADAGLQRVYSLSGNQIMPLYDALIDVGVAIVHTRHEAAAVHMADASARISGTAGIALLTAGPGHANGVSALYTAFMSGSPVVALSGHAPLARAGQGAFQEMDQAAMAAPVCKAAWTASSAADLGAVLHRALATAVSGRPGPVHVSVPFDVLQQPVRRVVARDAAHCAEPVRGKRIRKLARWLRKGERPLILMGAAFAHGARRAVAARLDGAGGVPALVIESPRGINDPALGAFAEMLARADRVLLLGRDLDFCLGFGESPAIDAACRFAHLDATAEILARSHRMLARRLRRRMLADPAAGAAALAEALAAGPGEDAWRDELRAAVNHRPDDWRHLTGASGRGLHPAEVCRGVQAFLDGHADAILVADGGEFGQWAQACVHAPRRIINGPAGAIGAALPFAAGARLAAPGASVVAMLGDGTAGFHLAEFDTALRAGAPYVAVIGNDARWNAEHQIQLRDYGPARLVGCELLPTRYDRAAEALGGHGEHVTRPDELGPALARAAASGKPACVNVVLDGQPAPVIRRSSPAR